MKRTLIALVGIAAVFGIATLSEAAPAVYYQPGSSVVRLNQYGKPADLDQASNYFFRDFYWGESLKDIRAKREAQFVKTDSDGVSIFNIILNTDESHELSGLQISRISALMWKNKLYAMNIYFEYTSAQETYEKFNNLNYSLKLRYGDPYARTEDAYFKQYTEGDTLITAQCPLKYHKILLNLQSLSIAQQMNEEHDALRREQANQGW